MVQSISDCLLNQAVSHPAGDRMAVSSREWAARIPFCFGRGVRGRPDSCHGTTWTTDAARSCPPRAEWRPRPGQGRCGLFVDYSGLPQRTGAVSHVPPNSGTALTCYRGGRRVASAGAGAQGAERRRHTLPRPSAARVRRRQTGVGRITGNRDRCAHAAASVVPARVSGDSMESCNRWVRCPACCCRRDRRKGSGTVLWPAPRLRPSSPSAGARPAGGGRIFRRQGGCRAVGKFFAETYQH